MKSLPVNNSIQNFKSRKDWEDHIWGALIKNLIKSNSIKELEMILSMLLTANEKKQIINRASATSLLKQGKSYKEIGELLWLSPNTISSIRKSLQEKDGYVSRHTRNKTKKSIAEKHLEHSIFDPWIKSLFPLPPPPIPHPRLVKQIKKINETFK